MIYLNSPQLLQLRFSNGKLILPYFYGRIMAKLNNQSYSGDNVTIKDNVFSSLFKMIKGLKKVKYKQADLLSISSTRWEQKDEKGYKNIQHGYYYDLFPNSFLMLEFPDVYGKWKTFNTNEPMSTIGYYINILSEFLSSLCLRLKPIHNKDLEAFHKECTSVNYRELEFADYNVRFLYYFWKKILKQIKPRVILLNCGSYGEFYGIICRAAHELGITSIDTQHGEVFNHKVYVASDLVKNSEEYMSFMPDYFFSFGKYWSDCVEWPYTKIEVGNPFLNDYAKKYSTISPIHDFLIISQPTGKEEQHSFVKELANTFPEKEIRVRLHPFDNYELEVNYFSNLRNVVVTKPKVNLYADMCSSKRVIGWYSTCLFELLAFGRNPIIVNSPFSQNTFPKELGIWIDHAKEIETIKESQLIIQNPSYYWEQDFQTIVKTNLEKLMNSK